MQNDNQYALEILTHDLGLTYSSTDAFATLSAAVNEMLVHQFDKLVAILYRMDVSELKLKASLATHPEANAGDIVARLMIERQVQKIKSRRESNQRDDNIPDEEKW